MKKSIIFHIDHLFGDFRIQTDRKGKEEVIGIDLRQETIQLIAYARENDTKVVGYIADRDNDKSIDRVLDQYFDEVVCRISISEFISASNQKSKAVTNVFISADRFQRKVFYKSCSVFPSAKIAQAVMEQGDLHLVSIVGPGERIRRLKRVIAYQSEQQGKMRKVLALVPEETIKQAIVSKLSVQRYKFDYSLNDLAYTTLEGLHRVEELEGVEIITSDGEKALLSLSPDSLNEDLPLHGEHGHSNFLFPDIPIEPIDKEGFADAQQEITLAYLHELKYKIKAYAEYLPLKIFLLPSTANSFKKDAERYSGVTDLDIQGKIISRHIQHPDNTRAVNALVNDLNAMGYCAYKHAFSYGGKTYHNVIADLPGKGCFWLSPKVLDHIRELLLTYYRNYDFGRLRKNVLEVADKSWQKETGFAKLPPVEAIRKLELLYDLTPWKQWWKPIPIAGIGAKIVVVACHLDSTAGYDIGYNPATDSAPGKDDNASGIAGVLATARYLSHYKNKLKHTVRFCFFNAEEAGLVGSKAYTSCLNTQNAPVKAAICMDMIGYNSDANKIYEVHCGYTDSLIRDKNLPFGNIMANWGNHVGLTPQVYQGTSSSNSVAPNRNLYDGAINRSDHAAFHQYGFPGVLLSEDFFANLNSEPSNDPNPNYHRSADTTVDNAYASDIICSVAYGIKQIASS